MQVNAEDITVPWGRAPDPLDQQMQRWRIAVFQDMQAAIDGSKLYWLYDPIADENSQTSGARKGGPSILVFDTNVRCFVRDIQLSLRPNVEGVPKYFFPLKSPSPAGGTALVLCTQMQGYGSATLQFWRLNMTADGMNLAGQMMPLLHNPIPVGEDWIVCMREDAPELALLTGPGLTVWRINADSPQPTAPIDSFGVPDGDMRRYYDGFIHGGSFYLLASTHDGTFDFSHVHKLDITGHNRMIPTGTRPDSMRGYPPPRKQAALDCTGGHVLLAGGEWEDPNTGFVQRLVDYWTLNLATLEWHQLPGQMPLPLIEPRLTATNFGQVFVWGDFDQPLPGMPSGTHVRILRMSGMAADAPPSYGLSMSGGSVPPYPTSSPPTYQQVTTAPPYPANYPSSNEAPYPQSGSGGYPQQQPPPGAYGQAAPSYPQQGGFGGGYPQQQVPYSAPNSGYPQQMPPGQQAFYPPDNKKKDCSIM
uniref:Uncharacterized protein n=1 Tax=Plectus sambesii TaxID=2011161 RepID=A0A914XH61_9BILA